MMLTLVLGVFLLGTISILMGHYLRHDLDWPTLGNDSGFCASLGCDEPLLNSAWKWSVNGNLYCQTCHGELAYLEGDDFTLVTYHLDRTMP